MRLGFSQGSVVLSDVFYRVILLSLPQTFLSSAKQIAMCN